MWIDADRLVDELLTALAAKRAIKSDTAMLRRLGPAAVPRLLHHLRTGDRRVRTMAFFGLQHCWSRAARQAVAPYLADDDAELRLMAAIVLVRGDGYERFADLLEPLVDDPRPEVVEFALGHLEAERPDLARTLRFLPDPRFRPALAKGLARYHHPALIPALAAMAGAALPGQAEAAVAALIHCNADGPAERALYRRLLAEGAPAVGDVAAVALMWHGTDDDRAALAERADPVAAAAIAAIARRQTRPSAVSPEERSLYRDGEPMEPHLAYRGNGPSAAFIAAREARLTLQARLFAIPWRILPPLPPGPPPPARRFVEPVRGALDSPATTFGKEIEDTAVEGFNGLVHVGDDLAWDQPHAPVLAIADGVVAGVSCTATWGTMVIVEHAEPDGERFCSLYAHLSPFVTVRPGEVVAAGQCLGAVGRAFTWENGGYAAHLHFAIHDGPFRRPPPVGETIDLRWHERPRRGVVSGGDETWLTVRLRSPGGSELVRLANSWVTGYVSRHWWAAGDHGWRDPRVFLGRRVKSR